MNLICLDQQLELPNERIKQCLVLLTSKQSPTEENLKDEQFLLLNQDTSDLYGILHARYIRTSEGKFPKPATD
jgi:hypothetical protein